MKIILLQDIKGIGKKFDVKSVKDGYARNFLLPRGLAKIATEQVTKELETQKAVWEKEEQEVKKQLEALAKDLVNQELRFTLKTGKKGEIFGSVTKDDIKKAILASISNFKFLISNDDVEIDLDKPIKKLGEHQVEIDLGRETKTKIKIIVESA